MMCTTLFLSDFFSRVYSDSVSLIISLFQEILLLSQLEHKNIVQYFGAKKVRLNVPNHLSTSLPHIT